MPKKVFVMTLILSVVVTYGVAVMDAIQRNSLLAGKIGFPLRFSSSYFFKESTDFLMLFIDIAFWFAVILVIWFGIRRLLNK
ncbi:MAG: hypothetical protein Q8P92_01390 [Candidatus Daviesbacteria bacterium]|nr:hypothetical protein [Candidatus Daviesbacteria bacterium]